MTGATCLFWPANMRCMRTPIPSMTPSRIPHMTPDPSIILGPLRTASAAPVMKPAITPFFMSSVWRTLRTMQSDVPKTAPHMPKAPPSVGPRCLIAASAAGRRSPCRKSSVPRPWPARGHATYPGAVAAALDAVPKGATNSAHSKGGPGVVKDYPWTRVASVVGSNHDAGVDRPGRLALVEWVLVALTFSSQTGRSAWEPAG